MLALERRFNAPCANGLVVVIDKLPNELIQLRLRLTVAELAFAYAQSAFADDWYSCCA